MSKKILKVVVSSTVVCLVLATGVVAFAQTGNIGTVENARLEFQKVMNTERVKNGDLTQEKADEMMVKMQEKFAESDGDMAYKQRGDRGGKGGMGTVETYAELVGKESKEIMELMKTGEKSIWQIAEDDGKFAAFKTAVIADIDEQIAKTDDADKVTKLNEQKAQITAMTTAADAPARPEGARQGGKGGEKANSAS